MKGHKAVLRGNRDHAHRLVDNAPAGSILTIEPPTRTLPQNSLLWVYLSKISRAKPEGRTLTPDVWKALFMHSLDHELRFEMALDGKGFVPMGFRSSRMTKAQMADLITVIEEYAAKHGVQLHV